MLRSEIGDLLVKGSLGNHKHQLFEQKMNCFSQKTLREIAQIAEII